MQTQAAEAARADAPTRSNDDWSTADDDTLVRGILKRNEHACLELLYRIEALTKQL